ncbi:MFS transporter [Saccharopolyspora sp. 5N102]|uniref:MFS transporter n=1 Tax=Saccharopolyspora sp. 5N102 TaxID=3375155 RepID=UPI003797506C
MILAAGSFLVAAAGGYITVTGVLDYATRELGLPRQTVLVLTLLVSVTGMITLPVFAALSDRVGRLRVYLCGAVGLMIWAIPMFLLIDTGNLVALVIAMFVTTVCITMMSGPQGALFAELFEPQIRYTGASIGYQLGTTIGGGLAPFVMVLLLETTGTSMSISAYIIALGAVAVVSIRCLLKRTRAGVHMHHEATAPTEA